MTHMAANLSAPAVVSPPPAELRDPALAKIRDLIYRNSGIYQSEPKFYLLANRCQRRMKAVGSGSYQEYFERLTLDSDRDGEMRRLLNEITIGETCMFRNQPQVDALTKVILPKLATLKSKQFQKKIRFWSAGCSTGEEPYTLSIVMLQEIATRLKGWTFEIVATDLNDQSLAKCKEGLYTDYALRNTALPLREKYFQKEGELYRVSEEVRGPIKFDRLNLSDQTRMLFQKGLDVIFCCNVLIYFDGASKRQTVGHFYNSLIPGGYFFLGHSESLFGIYDQFRLVHFPNATAYYKPLGNETAGAPQ